MASKTQQTEKIRARKHAPNKINLKVEEKRLNENYKVLARLAKDELSKES
jgi:hypothetical protein